MQMEKIMKKKIQMLVITLRKLISLQTFYKILKIPIFKFMNKFL
jgi:hypothetical protein